ncbi:MAG: transposase [Firmicutes bacterium]|nr:transposase [Bacillota bacterium]
MEELVPRDHLLRRIDQAVDFSFIYDKVRHLYSEDNGRPSIDPVVLFKMTLIGYLYGIPSERRLEQEVRLNLAYRWFLGLEIDDPVPDHSTFSQNRRRRFHDAGLFQSRVRVDLAAAYSVHADDAAASRVRGL